MNDTNQIFTGVTTKEVNAKPPYDWINSAIRYPYLIAQEKLWCELILGQDISNPVQWAKYVLQEQGLDDISPRLFYKCLFNNEDITDLKRLFDAFLILRVSERRELALRHINDLLLLFSLSVLAWCDSKASSIASRIILFN